MVLTPLPPLQVKNFQLESRNDPGNPVFMFGKHSKNEYILDYAYPLPHGGLTDAQYRPPRPLNAVGGKYPGSPWPLGPVAGTESPGQPSGAVALSAGQHQEGQLCCTFVAIHVTRQVAPASFLAWPGSARVQSCQRGRLDRIRSPMLPQSRATWRTGREGLVGGQRRFRTARCQMQSATAMAPRNHALRL